MLKVFRYEILFVISALASVAVNMRIYSNGNQSALYFTGYLATALLLVGIFTALFHRRYPALLQNFLNLPQFVWIAFGIAFAVVLVINGAPGIAAVWLWAHVIVFFAWINPT